MEDILGIRARHHIPSSDIRKEVVLTSNYRAGIPPLEVRQDKPAQTYKLNNVELSDDYADGFYIMISRSNRFEKISVALVWNNHYIDANGHEVTHRYWFNNVDYCHASSDIGSFSVKVVKRTVSRFLEQLHWLTEQDYQIVSNVTEEALTEFLNAYYIKELSNESNKK